MDSIEGTWRLVGAKLRDDVGNPRPLPYEGQGMGRIVIGGGRMAVMMIDWRREVPSDQKRVYSGYTGTYTYDGKQLVTTVDASPIPERIGTKQPRGVRFENGLMILIPPPQVVEGVTEHAEVAWEKISDA
jgi:Lipocalin-like domain